MTVSFVPANAVGGPGPPRGKQPPSNTTPPAVSGSAVVGSTLTGDAGTWSGSGIKLSYQWERCGSSGGGCASVAGATSTSLALGDGDVGYRFRVSVTASNKNGSESATSDLSPAVAPAPAPAPAPPPSSLPPTLTTAPSITGQAQEGQTLSASAGAWSGTQPLAYRYQWQRCDANGAWCAAVTGASTQTYPLTANDVGATVRVSVTASNPVGTATAASAQTSVVSSSLTPTPTPAPTPTGLTWAPPALSSPTTVQVQNTGQACPSVTSPWQNPTQPSNCVLDPAKDYVLRLGHRTDAGGLVVRGGRNVVIIGGWITPRLTTTAWEGRGLTFWNQTGTVHVEGVLIDGAGDGILIYAPLAKFQIENVRISVSAPNHDFSLNHPDVIQTWSGPAEMRVDRMTASSDYQGFYWYRDTSVSGTVLPGRVIQKRVNTVTDPTQNGTSATLHNVAYLNDPSISYACEDCWMQTGWSSTSYRRKLQESVAGYYNAGSSTYTMPSYRVVGFDGQVVTSSAANDVGRRQGDYIEWLGVANLSGLRWYWGAPAGGDFVPAGLAGTGYASPGYAG